VGGERVVGPGGLTAEEAALMAQVGPSIVSGEPHTERKSTFQVFEGGASHAGMACLIGRRWESCQQGGKGGGGAPGMADGLPACLPGRLAGAQAHVAPVETVAQVKAMVAVLLQNNKIRNATHNMMAYRIPLPG